MDEQQQYESYPQPLKELLQPSDYSRELLFQAVANREPIDKVTPEFFLLHYMDFVSLVIAKGKPSKDTLITYKNHIEKFLDWCLRKARMSPFKLDEKYFEVYRKILYETNSEKGIPYDDNTIHTHFAAVRAFYRAAIKQGIIKENPCADIKTKTVYANDRAIAYYTVDEIKEIIECVKANCETFEALRNLACIFLMAVAGLRCVEVHRANQEDIDWNNLTMVVHGKGHDGLVYLDESTANVIQDYLDCLEKQSFQAKTIKGVTPLIVTNATNRMGTRLSREAIRWNTNRILKEAGVKEKGIACHVFRHSCATALYNNTRDLRVVQDTLRHKNPVQTARYAHIVEFLETRPTASIGKVLTS